ncbi:hypothetical protein MNEG_10462 [Monoraphidium neglectum]|uniref:Uncharacterized protein n=1 Tax=Monoraphidium neglectum TaxID=145388 RepID=A0A0D2M8Y2_9CHLO|nr:hypothetical protein MNEG_10462 [Monoraphidium neglectum]KIY97501.1 hypothetical protein MNEG_10462 [Monoraphidium neglectum]|eukprot:XP_013896521.1 hypothetical protein MNEG_10462 [Monoraphidium neglectum]
MESAIVALEQRAVEAEARMSALEKQLASGTKSGPSGVVAADLQELRALLVAAQGEQQALREERDEAVKAAAKAEEAASKAEYRATHLARALREADAALAAAKAS